jgi:protein phosphatase
LGASDRRPRDDEIDVYGLTHPGKVRSTNQDHFLIGSLRKHMQVLLTSLPGVNVVPKDAERLAFLAMVADGVGGTGGGEEASRFAVEAITEYVAHATHCYYAADLGDEHTFARALEAAAHQVHADILERRAGDSALERMATTLTMWIGVWPRFYILQVGDSRCYLLREGRLIQLSRDQTLAQDLVDRGVFRRSEAVRTPLANVLSSALGGPESAPVVTSMLNDWNNVGLLCSDGLTKHVSDERIRERLLSMTSAKDACEALLRDALDAGGTDNITVIVGRMVRKDAA